MKQETFDLIHRNYVIAVEQSNNILEIIRNLSKLLSNCTVCEEDLYCMRRRWFAI